MIEQVLAYIHNYFPNERYGGIFYISEGKLGLTIQNDQYFRICGSVFNDGVYKMSPELMLKDEEFYGEVWLLAVPQAVIDISAEIDGWCAKYSDAINSPYQSESFGGYSYSKGSSVGANGATNSSADWRSVFSSRLKQWRRLADDYYGSKR